jgi:hypothetical protein
LQIRRQLESAGLDPTSVGHLRQNLKDLKDALQQDEQAEKQNGRRMTGKADKAGKCAPSSYFDNLGARSLNALSNTSTIYHTISNIIWDSDL